MPRDESTSERDWIFCSHCGQKYDPTCLDQVRYHANVPHKPILATGIIGEKVEPKEPNEER